MASDSDSDDEYTAEIEGIVREAKDGYYNLTLSLSPEASYNYTKPGQYVMLSKISSSSSSSCSSKDPDPEHDPASFFVASAPSLFPCNSMEFLIYDVPDSTADDLIKSKIGDQVQISFPPESTGFDLPKLTDVNTLLLFASGFGISTMRAVIEQGLEKLPPFYSVSLYHLYGSSDQLPYAEKYKEWKSLGVEIIPCTEGTIELNIVEPQATGALLCASEDDQTDIKDMLLKKGVSEDKILTVFDGYTQEDSEAVPAAAVKTFKNHKCGAFLPMTSKYIPSKCHFK